MSRKQLAEQRKYDLLERNIGKEPRKITHNGSWFKEYCKNYGSKIDTPRRKDA